MGCHTQITEEKQGEVSKSCVVQDYGVLVVGLDNGAIRVWKIDVERSDFHRFVL